jgi:hypothetical protein
VQVTTLTADETGKVKTALNIGNSLWRALLGMLKSCPNDGAPLPTLALVPLAVKFVKFVQCDAAGDSSHPHHTEFP